MNGKFLLSYLDYFIYLLTVFSALFILSFIQIQEDQKKGNIIDPAQFIIEMTWADGSDSDVDLWVAGPNGNIVYFNHKDSGVLVLDRDDLGINNSVVNADGTFYINKSRREVATIRTIVPGTYTVNVMMYNNRENHPQNTRVTIRRLNPYEEVFDKTLELGPSGEEKTALQFDLDENGHLSNTNTDFTPLSKKAP